MAVATTSVVRTAAAAVFRAPPIGLSANHNSPKLLSLPLKTHGIIIKTNCSFTPKSSHPRASSGETTETQQQVEEDLLDSQLQVSLYINFAVTICMIVAVLL